jgi:hypothetical protein
MYVCIYGNTYVHLCVFLSRSFSGFGPGCLRLPGIPHLSRHLKNNSISSIADGSFIGLSSLAYLYAILTLLTRRGFSSSLGG